MKTAINKIKLAATVVTALITTFSINSCKKASSPDGPTVTTITLTSGVTVVAGTSTVFTITGINLTGATVTTTASGVTISGTTVTGSTSITGTMAINASFPSGTVTLTITTPIGGAMATFTVVGIPVIGGYISSDSVAAANLVSYFSFDGNVTDIVASRTDTAVGVTYVPGIRGMAYQGAPGAYATVPASPAFSNLQSFSVSVWYSYTSATRPQVPVSGEVNQQGIFFVSGNNTATDGNLIMLYADDPSASQFAADSIMIKHGFNNIGAGPNSWQNFTLVSYDTATSKWVHVVMTYDGPSSAYKFYENGVPIDVASAYGVSTSTTIYNGPLPLGSGTERMGNLSFAPDPPKTLIIGGWPPFLYGVSNQLGGNGSFLGAMDELRVYNVALTQAEVVGLYLNGLAGR